MLVIFQCLLFLSPTAEDTLVRVLCNAVLSAIGW